MRKKWSYMLICLGITLAIFPAAPASALPGSSRYFPETGHNVSGAFLEFYDLRGGPFIFGYPITEEIYEGGRTVQYFEKARFEWHSENDYSYNVQLGLLGLQLYGQADPPVPDVTLPGQPNERYFRETGHIVRGLFLSFFDSYGGVDIFGYPITEEFVVNDVLVQYFQRARMELYPHYPYWVHLGNIGTEWLNKNPLYLPQPSMPRSRYFPATGCSVKEDFLEFFEKNGGVEIFGNPISEEFVLDGVPQQYFERARLERREGHGVVLAPLGLEVHGGIDPAVPDWTTPWSKSQVYFPETGHVVSNAFLDFYNTHGGPFIFGPPITEAQLEGGRIVQFFRNFQMEWHPEDPLNKVYLASLGSLVYHKSGRGTGEPSHYFGEVWRDNPKVRQGLGGPVSGEYTVEMAEQWFEGGYMLWRKDINKIYILYKGGYWQAFDNPWKPGDLESRGTTPPEGRQEPVKSFGKIWWRLGGPEGQIGWALGPQRDFEGQYQELERGLMIRVPEKRPKWKGPERREFTDWIYVLYNNGSWEMYQDLFYKSYMQWDYPQ